MIVKKENVKLTEETRVNIQTEMSIEPLYNGEATWLEMIDFLDANGFRLMHLNSGFRNPKTGQTLQVEGVFIQSHAVESAGFSNK